MPSGDVTLPDWRELIRLSDPELAEFDIAVMNLACAVGLPGSERIDAAGCLKYLDRWADAIRNRADEEVETEFRRESATYQHNEPLFRMVKLVHFLQRRAKVLYNPARIDPAPGDRLEAEDDFIFGAIQGPGGTCASLPVVYTAVARRVGYPVYLVWTKGHAFCRWDDPRTGIKVNIEGTNHDGVSAYPDDHYRKWPNPFGAREEEDMGHLRSLSPREELTSFLDGRRLVWECAGEQLQAIDALVGAIEADRHPFPRYELRLEWTVRQWGKQLKEQGRIGHGFRYPLKPLELRRWPRIPWPLEAEIHWLDAAERGTIPPWAFGWDDSGRKPNVRL